MSINIKLSKPAVFNGVEYHELNLKFEESNGVFIRRAEKLARGRYKLTDMWLQGSDTYRLIFASMLLKITLEELETLPLRDCMQISKAVLDFFGEMGLDDTDDTAETVVVSTTQSSSTQDEEY